MDDDYVERVRVLYAAAMKLQSDVTLFASDILVKLQQRGRNVSEPHLTDLGFFLRETADALDEARKELNAKQTLVSRSLAFAIITRATATGSENAKATGKYAFAQPDVKQRPILPKRGTPEMAALLSHFKIENPDVIEHELVGFNWPRMSDYITALAGEGKDPPPGVGALQPEYIVIYRKRNAR